MTNPSKESAVAAFIFQKPFSSHLPESLNESGEESLAVKTCSYFSYISVE